MVCHFPDSRLQSMYLSLGGKKFRVNWPLTLIVRYPNSQESLQHWHTRSRLLYVSPHSRVKCNINAIQTKRYHSMEQIILNLLIVNYSIESPVWWKALLTTNKDTDSVNQFTSLWNSVGSLKVYNDISLAFPPHPLAPHLLSGKESLI